MEIHFREASPQDISGMSHVRLSVQQNKLSRPDLITRKDYEDFIMVRGKGRVAEAEGSIIGFAIVDLQKKNFWALFMHPDWEGKGIGQKLQEMMLDWYFAHTTETIWLSTERASRAEHLYRKTGWKETGLTEGGEVRFEMDASDWIHGNKVRH